MAGTGTRLHYMLNYGGSASTRPYGIPSDYGRIIDEKIDDGIVNRGRVGVIINCTGFISINTANGVSNITKYQDFSPGCNVVLGINIR